MERARWLEIGSRADAALILVLPIWRPMGLWIPALEGTSGAKVWKPMAASLCL